MIRRNVTYALEIEGRLFVVENVPASVCEETGEQYFSSETEERLRQLIWENREPDRVIEVPVFEFASF
jgi:YgiT-type zinc finger domain-containing protein